MKLGDIKVGDTVMLDDSFACVRGGPHVVQGDGEGTLFVACHGSKPKTLVRRYRERHYLDGQEDERGDLVGVSPVQSSEASS